MLYTQAQIDALKKLENMWLYCQSKYYVAPRHTVVGLFSTEADRTSKNFASAVMDKGYFDFWAPISPKGMPNKEAFAEISPYFAPAAIQLILLSLGKQFHKNVCIYSEPEAPSKSYQLVLLPTDMFVLGDDETWRKGIDRLYAQCTQIAEKLIRNNSLAIEDVN